MASTVLLSQSSLKRQDLPTRPTTTTETLAVTATTLSMTKPTPIALAISAATTATVAAEATATAAPTTKTSLTTTTTNSSHYAVPAQIVTALPEAANRRGHMRSASLENGAKNSLGSPIVGQPDHGNHMVLTGTLKSRNEQKRLRNKFGSHSNLEDYLQPTRNTINSNNLTSNINGGSDGISNKFQNIRQMFEISRNKQDQLLSSWQQQHRQQHQYKQQSSDDDLVEETQNQRQRQSDDEGSIQEPRNQQQQHQRQQYHQQQYQEQQQRQLPTPRGQLVCQQNQHQYRELFQQHQQQQKQIQQQNSTPISATTTIKNDGCRSRNSVAIVNERLNINESCSEGNNTANNNNNNNNNNRNYNHNKSNDNNNSNNNNSTNSNSCSSLQNFRQVAQQLQQTQQQQQQQLEQQQPHQHQRSASDLQQFAKVANSDGMSFKSYQTGLESQTQHLPSVQTTNPQRSIAYAFKPIPFEPDYSIPMRYCHVGVGDRYGSTPSLAPAQGSNFRFSSTNDLRLGSNCGIAGGGGGGGGGVGIAGSTNGNIIGNSGSSYCNSLLARRRGSRSVKINDSLESIRHTPDSDTTGQSSLNKLYCSNMMNTNNNNNNSNNNSNNNNRNNTNNNNCSTIYNAGNPNVNANDLATNNFVNIFTSGANKSSGSTNSNNNNNNINNSNNNNNYHKYILNDQCDMTPSPSDSGISELDATQKDRDSELSTTIASRQLMEVHEKANIRQEKETFWASDEVKRLRYFYEGQQREYCLKLKKMEQMLAMQQFQFKQNKLRLTDSNCKIKEQLAELKNENEALRSSNICLRTSERNYKDRAAYLEVQLQGAHDMLASLKIQLEENEWKVCERNGEIALLKTQLKEANTEITMKERALVNFKHENTSYEDEESRIYESLKDNKTLTAYKDADCNHLQRHNNRDIEMELKQLNKIIILKDQVILALTNELAKLRKELSDLAISQEYGEEPSGKFTRLKHQLDNLTDICSRARPHVVQEEYLPRSIEGKAVDDINLEVIMNCLKTAPILKENCTILPNSTSSSFDCIVNPGENKDSRIHSQSSTDQRFVKMSTAIQNFVYGSQNLPDIAVNIKTTTTGNTTTTSTATTARSVASASNTIPSSDSQKQLEETTLDSLIAESSNYAEQIIQLRNQLDHVRESFEKEKLQWCEEREKVLSYQKQLQTHYINMYQKLRSLQKTDEHEV